MVQMIKCTYIKVLVIQLWLVTIGKQTLSTSLLAKLVCKSRAFYVNNQIHQNVMKARDRWKLRVSQLPILCRL